MYRTSKPLALWRKKQACHLIFLTLNNRFSKMPSHSVMNCTFHIHIYKSGWTGFSIKWILSSLYEVMFTKINSLCVKKPRLVLTQCEKEDRSIGSFLLHFSFHTFSMSNVSLFCVLVLISGVDDPLHNLQTKSVLL